MIYTDDKVEKHPNKRKIAFSEVQKFARDKGCLCMEGSALSGRNVNAMFESVVRRWAELHDDHDYGGGAPKSNPRHKDTVDINQKGGKKKDKGCC